MSELPAAWAVAQGRDLFRFVRGVSFAKQQMATTHFAGSVGILRAGNIQRGELSLVDLVYVPSTCVSEDQRLRKGDLVIAMSSGSASVVGKVALCTADHNEISFGTFCGVLRPHDVGIAAWLAEYFSTAEYRRIISELAAGININNLRAEHLLSLNIPIPSRSALAKSSKLLAVARGHLRATRADVAQVRRLVEHLRRAILAAAFRGDLTADWREKNPDVEPSAVLLGRIRQERRQKREESELGKMRMKGSATTENRWKEKYVEPDAIDATDLPDLPGGWCWTAWQTIGWCQNGRAFPSQAYTTAGTKLLRPGNLHARGTVEWTPANTRYMPEAYEVNFPDYVVHGRELVINLTAQSLKDEFLGRVCLTSDGEHCLLNQRIARLTPVGIATEFCLWLFKSPRFRAYVDELNTGSLIQHMFVSQIDAFVLPLPPVAEQNEIVHRVRRAMAVVTRVEEVVTLTDGRSEELEAAILAKAFRGDLVPQDPNDEPAAVLLERIQRGKDLRSAPPKRRPLPVRAPKEKSAMAKSRLDDDVFGKPYLAMILTQSGGSLRAHHLFSRADLPVVDFYKQLLWEVDQAHIKDLGDELVAAHAN